MAAELQSAGAASHQERGWHAIDWQTAHQEVRRLQVRIMPLIGKQLTKR